MGPPAARAVQRSGRMRIWFCVLVVCCLAACKAGYAPVAPTSQLIRQPALAAEADALGDEDARGVGARRLRRHVELLVREVRGAPREADPPPRRVALLRHRSPIVRGYVARHLAQSQYGEIHSLSPAVVAGLRPILRDETVVGFVDGCWVSEAPIGEYVVLQLCQRGDKTSRLLLDELVASGHPRAQVVKECR